ncbi:RNA polymerase sigma factor [Patiriisocius marinus]|uniref:DNA-directed RNA polymerase sigma-70 factor n=1 Tax=Patiriisocius marinus TaxID=1397112 RepID=A0A5J4IMR1_9FLAO|nr:sigma-70 family RNA polymerase sigma factor [Patiriisocius marinus]GER58585.1 DNA-directed RNA polymerase sigma-70 factor [Patiriisocius marinus]
MKKNLSNHCCEKTIFDSIFRKHAENIHKFLHYRYGSLLNPQDKVQDAFIKLWQNCKSVPPDKAKSFLFTTANNLMLNEVKHQKVVLNYVDTKPKNHTNINPEFLLEEAQYLEKLQKALTSLTENERVAFMLNRTEGKRYKEIAALLDISVSAVEKRIYSALLKLRKEIKEI